ncbi:MAG: segregation and condensation protein A [Aphanocapsa feldmannii 277cV]|uniref:Segregation and condensation protein A n=2 Tax=Aphanocapsa feldmannii TaxID=192050 RepID=A0A524RN95_9CHRO|nr:MAG: segregation and condensation protein A [Aphanocapsa feldmannii 277cV]TGH26443.1 MAG: segregation and condensation protein A [Aphanocapsa feldmannii 277cI]
MQDAVERGVLDPWDVDVIGVIDGFLDELRLRVEQPRLMAVHGGSYEQDLADSSAAFLSAAVLLSLKSQLLEQDTFPVENPAEQDPLEADCQGLDQGTRCLPRHPERHLARRPTAPPPLQRPVTLAELIRQLETIAAQLEEEGDGQRGRTRPKRISNQEAASQVASLAHREKLPETTAALNHFLDDWAPAARGADFEALVRAWAMAAPPDLDRDRLGVFWALLFLCSQGRVDISQEHGLFGPIQLMVRPGAAGRMHQPPLPLCADQAGGSVARPATLPATLPMAA